MTKCYGTKHRVKRARAEGEIPRAEGRDIGKSFSRINYAARGRKKNKGD